MKQSRIRERKRRKCILMVWSLLGLIGLLWLVSLSIRLVTGSLLGEHAGEHASEQAATFANPGQAGGSTVEDDYEEVDAKACKQLYEEYKELLVLVNREHALEEGIYEDTLRSICNGRLRASDYLYDDLVEMLAAADDAGYQYWIASAYRSRERQQELVDEDINRYMAQGMQYKEALEKTYEQTMPAGKSEHETGLALDLLCSENLNMDISQAEEPGNKWLADHAHEYGFLLRYPEDKEDITAICYEPWHFRYVGREAARFLHENELTLEEFYTYLEK